VGSIAVSISAFQADGPGPTPGLRINKWKKRKNLFQDSGNFMISIINC
jgi:hypothetical protein